jgi:hypothetical protein
MLMREIREVRSCSVCVAAKLGDSFENSGHASISYDRQFLATRLVDLSNDQGHRLSSVLQVFGIRRQEQKGKGASSNVQHEIGEQVTTPIRCIRLIRVHPRHPFLATDCSYAADQIGSCKKEEQTESVCSSFIII